MTPIFFSYIYYVGPSIFPLNHPYYLLSSLLGSWFRNKYVSNYLQFNQPWVFTSRVMLASVTTSTKCQLYKMHLIIYELRHVGTETKML